MLTQLFAQQYRALMMSFAITFCGNVHGFHSMGVLARFTNAPVDGSVLAFLFAKLVIDRH